jgi:hypothetical protein
MTHCSNLTARSSQLPKKGVYTVVFALEWAYLVRVRL